MSLNPIYDVYPHGITKSGETVYAVFKVIVCFEGSETPLRKETFARNGDLRKEINSPWYWKYDNNLLKMSRSETNDEVKYHPVEFEYGSQSTSETSPSFHFGETYKEEGFEDALEFLQTEPFYWSGMNVNQEVIVDQIEQSGSSDQEIEGNYEHILSQANAYAEEETLTFEGGGVKTSGQVAATDGPYDFRSIYATIIDEPALAEKKYGFIRSFKLALQAGSFINIESSGQIAYQIQVSPASNPVGDFIIAAHDKKFYNGPFKLLFEPSDFFHSQTTLVDPYQNFLSKEVTDKSTLNPDGIYGIVRYKSNVENSKTIDDPFDNENIKGFNVLVIVREGGDYNPKIFSISLHQISYTILATGDLIQIPRTSGVLSPQSEIVISKDKAIRNNVLFAWRGDNLIVNRKTPDNIEKDGEQYIAQERDFANEDRYISSKLFRKVENLIDSSQLQLLASRSYDFYLRTVTPSEYYIPALCELSEAERKYTLSIEDVMGWSILPTPYLFFAKFHVSSMDLLRIRRLSIVGRKTYESKSVDSQYVDQAQHMVLHKKKETVESRFIFPPLMKFEEFRILGGTAKLRLLKEGESLERYGIDDYVSRCIFLEERIGNQVPRWQARKINYIADLRAKFVCFIPGDLFTATHLTPKSVEVFKFSQQFPFFKQTRSREIKIEVQNKHNIISIQNHNNTFEELSTKDGASLTNGIYNLKVYATDRHLGEIPWQDFANYGFEPLKITILDDIPAPVISQEIECPRVASRNMQQQDRNYWFFELTELNSSLSWKSLKYLEETEVLQLRHQNLMDLLDKYRQDNEVKPLFDHEYPYGMFLTKEGSISARTGLRTALYPKTISLSLQISDSLKNRGGYFFKLPLNEKEKLFCELDPVAGMIIKIENKIIFQSEDDQPLSSLRLEISFLLEKNTYAISSPRYESRHELTNYINPDISVNDIELDDIVIRHLNFNDFCKLSFEKSAEHVFIDNAAHSYYRKKTVQLFASSIFQAYFPLAKDEFEVGAVGNTAINIEIPNNLQPEQPIMEADILLLHTKDSNWDGSSKNIKESTTESIVRLTLQQEFMKEGKNKLGLILSGPSTGTTEEATISEIGEDITKLSRINWSSYNLDDLIDFEKDLKVINKYCSRSDIRYYQYGAGDSIYEVLECEPYYNSQLKKWQVILTFKFQRSETMFLKFVGIKIAKGVGYDFCRQKVNSRENPFRDVTQTNLSKPSSPIHLPVYNKKTIRLERILVNEEVNAGLRISNESSSLKDRVFFVMLFKVEPGNIILNPKEEFDTEDLRHLLSFDSLDRGWSDGQQTTGKILLFKNKQVKISAEKCDSIVVLEFEMHTNLDEEIKEAGDLQFVEFNPLFSRKGIRLVNVAQFKY